MSSVDKQILFSAYEVASLYVYDVLFPDYSDFDWYLHENYSIDEKEDSYAYLESCKLHEQYEDMTKKLLQSIRIFPFFKKPNDIFIQQFARPFLLDWFKKQGLECPALYLPANQRKLPPQKPVPNITINTTNNNLYNQTANNTNNNSYNQTANTSNTVEKTTNIHNIANTTNINNTTNKTVNGSESEESQSSNIMQKKEKMEPSDVAIILSAFESKITIKTGQKNNKVTIAKIFGRKKKQQLLFLAIAKDEGLLSKDDFKRTCSGSAYATRIKLLSELNTTLKESLSLKKAPFKSTQGGIATIFKEIRKAKSKNVGGKDSDGYFQYNENTPDAAGDEFLEEYSNKL